ncbi:leucine-rich repeat-containing protein 51-like [Linepithema humile]|uniref:leucine-rich repeat-containing protein 51-like n=1 Tax=Linepithema humile TaxID=83485 RepID=UPI00062379EA|nr:PREDICTED: leucine-rich repeat-containing protein 51-like [Linepithema humile]XP_012232764.1 PREDICTED: leucine-rich repeat-containing protein 51-like [Linepithema humile]
MSVNHFPESPISDYKRNERQEMLIAPPLDLSFKKATTMHELMDKHVQIVRTGKSPMRTFKDRYITSTMWLSNNLLRSMEGFQNLVNKFLENPIYLSWLDLSFNEISKIGEDIEKFTNLKILYLHGNKISNIMDVLRLKKLENLRSLTLHGNPIENVPCYRGYIVHLLPQLHVLDFSPVIAAERKKAQPVGFFKIMQSRV